jgi:murein DD-endopeptidase MepM/ murein hydrolase activator NlpD
VRRPLVEALGDASVKDEATAPAPASFQMGLLNDGALPPQDDPAYLLAPLPGYWMYDAPIGPRSTGDIFARLGNVLLLPTQIARLLAPFPVVGPANYSDDWGAPRHVPSYHPHAGTDIFAQHGTPVIASFDGVIAKIGRDTTIGGNSLRLVLPDGTFLYYAHLAGFARSIEEGAAVRQGDVLGFVGDTGNARGTPPHLHFEIHPGGGEPTPPVPYLDRWLADARVAVDQYAAVAVTPLAPVVAPPASVGTPAQQPLQPAPAELPIPSGSQAASRPELEGTAAATDAASPLAVLILLGVAALLFLMLRGSRRPRAAQTPTSAKSGGEPAWLGPFVPLSVGEDEESLATTVASIAGPASRSARRAAPGFEPLPLEVVATSPGDGPPAS